MVKSFVNLFLKLLSIGSVAVAAFLWADAPVDGRPKSRDEQTLVGGMIWSQLIILTGLIISDVIGEEINPFVHAYYLVAGGVLCGLTGVILVIDECRKTPRLREVPDNQSIVLNNFNDRVYLSIGLISFVASVLLFADFATLIYKNIW